MGYKTDLIDDEWNLIKYHFSHCRKRKHEKRILMNAVLYLIKTRCQWRMLPNDFPPHQTVHSFYRHARLSGLWKAILDDLVKKIRVQAKRSETPTYCIFDSQSVKTTYASEQRGIDGGKKTKRQKRHIITDIMGNLLFIIVHAANIHDTKSGEAIFQGTLTKYPSIDAVSGDAEYRKTFKEAVEELGKIVHIFQYPITFIEWMARIHLCLHMPYRQMEGFVRKLSEYIPCLRAADYTTLFRRIKALNQSLSSPDLLHSDLSLLLLIALASNEK